MNLSEATRLAIEWDLVADAAATHAAQARANLDELMRENGSIGQAGTHGTVRRVPGHQMGTITDMAALLKWTIDHHPEETQTTLRPAWLERVKRLAACEGVAYDPETGEVIPGVGARESPGRLRITVNPEARSTVARDLSGLVIDLGLEHLPDVAQ